MMTLRSGFPLAVCLAALIAAGAAWAEPSIADIQWAQRVLTEKGFDIGGRANGQMTGQTRKALKAYQAANGLSATGDLDNATVERMMAGRKAQPTMGSLSAPRPGTDRKALERDVVPRAAPTQRVQNNGGTDLVSVPTFQGSGGGAGNWTPSGSPEGARPAAVSGGGSPSSSHPSVAGAGPATIADASSPAVAGAAVDTNANTLPGGPSPRADYQTYARPVAAAVFGGTLFAILGAWWMSGRRRFSATVAMPVAANERRVEPTFDHTSTKRSPRQATPLVASGRPGLSA